jgi:hypothetical protein
MNNLKRCSLDFQTPTTKTNIPWRLSDYSVEMQSELAGLSSFLHDSYKKTNKKCDLQLFAPAVTQNSWNLLTPFTHSLTHSHSLTRSLTLTHPLTHSHSHAHSLSLTHTDTHTHMPTHTHMLTHTHMPTHSLMHTHWHSHALTHTHTHTLMFIYLPTSNKALLDSYSSDDQYLCTLHSLHMWWNETKILLC